MGEMNPVAAAGDTLEGKIAKVTTTVSLVTAVITAIGAAIAPHVGQVGEAVASRNWVLVIVSVGSLLAAAITAAGIALSRGKVKAAAISTNTLPMSNQSKV